MNRLRFGLALYSAVCGREQRARASAEAKEERARKLL